LLNGRARRRHRCPDLNLKEPTVRCRRVCAASRRVRPSFARNSRARTEEGVGSTGCPGTPANPVRAGGSSSMRRCIHSGGTGFTPAFPQAMVLTVCGVLPGDEFVLPTPPAN